MINQFSRKYFFLSNFYECPVYYDGLIYNSSEAAFQAAKLFDNREEFTKLNPPAAKKRGREVELRPDWDDVRIAVMYDVCYSKFAYNPYLKEKLLATGDEHLEEGNHHGDVFWGTVDGNGENNLGKVLMKIREDLRNNVKTDFSIDGPLKNKDTKFSKDEAFKNNKIGEKSTMNQKEGCFEGFDAEIVKGQLIEWIQNFFKENGPDCNAIVGISGGKDSSTVAALCVEALGRDRVIGVLMPNDKQSDIDCAKLLVNHLRIKYYIINIKDAVNGVLDQLRLSGVAISEQTIINLPARVRMATLYAISQSSHGRVANTCNLSEDWVGYATRYGDGAGDFSPLSKLTVAEVKEIGKTLNLPMELVEKIPVDGLSDKTDEDNLGFTYAVLDRYIRTGKIEDKNTKEKIDHMHKLNRFKLELMPSFDLNKFYDI